MRLRIFTEPQQGATYEQLRAVAVQHPPYLLRLKVGNFRSLRAVEVRLAPLNILVGPNGAGKSNLLDVIAFLGDATRDDLAPALDERGGFDRVIFRNAGKVVTMTPAELLPETFDDL